MSHFKRDMIAVGVFFLLLFVGWMLTGGPQSAYESGSYEDKFQRPIAPINSGETYDETIKEASPIKVQRVDSTY